MKVYDLVKEIEQVGIVREMSEVFTQHGVYGRFQVERVVDCNQADIILAQHFHNTYTPAVHVNDVKSYLSVGTVAQTWDGANGQRPQGR